MPRKCKGELVKALFTLFLAGVLSANFVLADPLASRDSARRYAKAIPIQEAIDDMLAHYVRDVPVQRRQSAANEIRNRLNNDKLLETYIDILVSVYTTEELDALANFFPAPSAPRQIPNDGRSSTNTGCSGARLSAQ